MLRKIAIGIACVFVLAVAGYTSCWFYAAHKIQKGVEVVLYQLSEDMRLKESDFFYSDIGVSGFPLAFVVDLYEPRFVGKYKDTSFEVFSSDAISFGSNVKGDFFVVTTPKQLQYLVHDQPNLPFVLRYKRLPEITVEVIQQENIPWTLKAFLGDFEDVNFDFVKFRYHDEGFVITEKRQEEVLIRADEIFISLDSLRNGGGKKESNFIVDMSGFNNDAYNKRKEFTQNLGDVELAADIGFVALPSETEDEKLEAVNVNIRELKMDTGVFGLDLRGRVDTSLKDPFPFGELFLKMRQYQGFVEYQGELINHMAAQTAFSFVKMDDFYKKAFKRFMRDIAVKEDKEQEELHFAFKRQTRDDLFIGEKKLPEVMRLFRRRFTKPAPPPPPVVDEAEEEAEAG